MAEFASNAKANTGVALGATGLGVAALNAMGGLGALGGIFGGGCGCNTSGGNTLVNRYELGLENENAKLRSEIALRDANIYNDQKLLEVYKYFDSKIEGINSRLCEQAVWNATQTASLSCMSGQIAQLMSLTRLVVPNSSVCPGWGNVTVTPSTTTAGA
jgi:hypothetical protein